MTSLFGKECPDIVETLGEVFAEEGEDVVDRLGNAEVESAEIEGDRAEIEFEDATTTIVLERDGDEWRITKETLEDSFDAALGS